MDRPGPPSAPADPPSFDEPLDLLWERYGLVVISPRRLLDLLDRAQGRPARG